MENKVNLVRDIPQKAVTISDLINDCNAAAATMGNNNPNKSLIMNCAYAMRQLVDRLDQYENPVGGAAPMVAGPDKVQ